MQRLQASKIIDSNKALIEIDTTVLKHLLKNKYIFASEMRYLNSESKELVRDICLQTCLK